jgi:hypothetical protein
LPPKCWDYRHSLPCPATSLSYTSVRGMFNSGAQVRNLHLWLKVWLYLGWLVNVWAGAHTFSHHILRVRLEEGAEEEGRALALGSSVSNLRNVKNTVLPGAGGSRL